MIWQAGLQNYDDSGFILIKRFIDTHLKAAWNMAVMVGRILPEPLLLICMLWFQLYVICAFPVPVRNALFTDSTPSHPPFSKSNATVILASFTYNLSIHMFSILTPYSGCANRFCVCKKFCEAKQNFELKTTKFLHKKNKMWNWIVGEVVLNFIRQSISISCLSSELGYTR